MSAVSSEDSALPWKQLLLPIHIALKAQQGHFSMLVSGEVSTITSQALRCNCPDDHFLTGCNVLINEAQNQAQQKL